MLNDYYYDPQTLKQYRTGPVGEYLDEFIVWLEGLGFRYRSIRVWSKNSSRRVKKLIRIEISTS